MRLQDPNKEHAPFDVAPGLAVVFLRQGYTEIKPYAPIKVKHPMVWSVRDGAIEGDYQFPPVLFFSCPECGTRGMTESRKGTAHKSAKVYHCGERGTMCPPEIAAQYQKAFAAWNSRSLL